MKVALVTGGSRGIGRAICEELHKRGYYVLINYVSNDAAAQDCLSAIEGQGELLKFDVASPEAVKAALEGWQQAHPEEYITTPASAGTIFSSGWSPRSGAGCWIPTSIPGTM